MGDFVNEKPLSCISCDFFNSGPRIHFVGILGAGMLPLARLVASFGALVSGTDKSNRQPGGVLLGENIGFTPYHTARGLDGVDLIVYSLAVPNDSPELVFAKERGIPTVTRAELLGAIATRYKTSIAVAGTHGKSTTVAILTHILNSLGFSPTVVSGAALCGGDSLLVGGNDLFIAEACEYKNAFHSIKPTYALITNIDYDHVDCFSDVGEVIHSFQTFARGAQNTFINLSCGASVTAMKGLSNRVITYGTAEAEYGLTSYSPRAYKTDFTLKINGEIYPFTIPVAGLGALYDATLAIAAAHRIGASVSQIRDTVATFFGIERRLELLGVLDGHPVYYDYAHHPREIENTVQTLMRRHESLSVIFRPHTYSRTGALMDDFVRAFSGVESVALLDVYAARENPIPGATSKDLATRIGKSAVVCNAENALEYILKTSRGAIVLMGAGEVDGIFTEIKSRLDR